MSARNRLVGAILLALAANAAHASEAASSDAPPQQGAQEQLQEHSLDSITIEGRFLETNAKSAMKMDVPVRDTPFSVQSYGQAFIESVEAVDLGQMYKYMTGVKRAGATGFDIAFRGFKSSGDDQNSLLVDGLPGLAGRFGSPPTVALESVELVRGSMSVLYGQNQPGGFINMITKKPQVERATNVGLRTTAYAGHGVGLTDANGYLVDLDTTGKVDEAGTLLYRVIGEFGDRDTFRDYGYDKGKYLAPALTWNLGLSTVLDARLEYRHSDTSFDQGLVAPQRDIRRVAPITTYYSEPGNNRVEEGTTLNLALNHTFANGMTWNTAFRAVDYDSQQKEFSHVSVKADDHTLTRRARHLKTARDYKNFDSSLGMDFRTGPVEHKTTIGVTGGKGQVDETRLKFFNSKCPGEYCFDIDVYAPVYGKVPPFDDIPAYNPGAENTLTSRRFDTDNLALYVSDLMTLTDHWKLSVGLRSFRENQELTNLRDPAAPSEKKRSKKSALPMAGLLYQPDEHWTLYASYSESYVPADPANLDVNGNNPFDPLEGKQVELGVKAEGLMDGTLNASLALFRINQLNMMNSFSCPLGVCYDQLGEARSEGVEIEANWTPTERVQMTFGYAYTDARVTKSNIPLQVGAQLANAPRHMANTWLSYAFSDDWRGGFGLTYTGAYQGLVPSDKSPGLMPMPGATVADLALTYVQPSYSVNLKLGNLFDKTYYEATGLTAPVQVVPGAPRNITLSFRATF
ncbi:TonB-dependent receptor [Dokdonella sp.]|uniref:TonB-dependent siderophore receptor n=1 Tax=Dokdonella sp. TaxID=2291710 RepID=UPI0026120270|nr:TonB-dependent receptor [Dokdonella sp.]